MTEEKKIYPNDVQQGQNVEPESPKNKRGKWGLGLIILVIVLVGAGIFLTNKKSDHQPANQNGGKLMISQEEINNDFVDEEKRAKQDVTPPENVVERYSAVIKTSQAAIEKGEPSSAEFKDLEEDYLTVASSYNILGDFGLAEENYKKMIGAFPNSYKARANLGDLYISMRQYRQAASQYYQVMEIYPTDYRIYSKLATLYYNYANLDEATRIKKAVAVYEVGIDKADDKKYLYKEYSFFAENYAKDPVKAAEALKEYQKLSESKEEQAIEILEKGIEVK